MKHSRSFEISTLLDMMIGSVDPFDDSLTVSEQLDNLETLIEIMDILFHKLDRIVFNIDDDRMTRFEKRADKYLKQIRDDYAPYGYGV